MRVDRTDEPYEGDAPVVDADSPSLEPDTPTADRDGGEDSHAARVAYHLKYRALVEAEYRAGANDASAGTLPPLQRSCAEYAADRALDRPAINSPADFDRIIDVVKADAADAVAQTGARGIASGREFDPEAAGGPIQRVYASEANISAEGVRAVGAHLQRFAGDGRLEAPEQGMLDRLALIAEGDMDPTTYDLNFYTHELDEAERYAQLGYGPESGADLGSPEMYDVWNNIHTAALEDYGISGSDLFYQGLAP